MSAIGRYGAFFDNTTVAEQRETQENYHKNLHQNLYLLSLKYPMNTELASCFEEGMLKNPNSLAFNQLAYYLMSVIDPKIVTQNLLYLLQDPKSIRQFRKEFLNFVKNTSTIHKGYVSPIMASWLVTARGPKITKLMYELSQVALKVSIMRLSPPKDQEVLKILNNEIALNIDEKIKHIEEDLKRKTNLSYKFSKTMEKIYEMYEQQLESINRYIKENSTILEGLVAEIKQNIPTDDVKLLDSRFNIESSDILSEWDAHLDRRIKIAEKNWENASIGLKAKSHLYKNTCEEIILRYTAKDKADITMKYDPQKDTIRNYDVTDAIDNDIVRNGVLHLPSLFKAFNNMLLSNLRVFVFFKIDDRFFGEIENNKNCSISLYKNAKELNRDIHELHKKLREYRNLNMIPYKKSADNEWLYEAFNIPQIDYGFLKCFKNKES